MVANMNGTRQTRFKTVQELQLDYAPVALTQYESTRTGMRVAVVDHESPKVCGFFMLATEIHDDSGAPHTLEHLVFMGSKTYHYKGLLDKLAARAFSMTNAWTMTEQTGYTLETAGWAGFKQMLPVYLEHLVVPTLTDAACYTEVHHVDPTGHDTGVVYSEMQGVQNDSTELMDLAARRLLYPEGSGYRYETGGMMEQLRVLSADRIRAFHKEMYQPKNLCLVLTGKIDQTELLQILDRFEDSIIEDVPKLDEPFRRPWVDSKPTPPLKESIVKRVEFPEQDESMGEILLGYFGPKYNEHVDNSALMVLLAYLCGSSICVLDNTLVEKEQLCSDIVYTTDFKSETLIWFQLTAVETEKLETVEKRVIDLLKETASKELDMSYMNDCIKRNRRRTILTSEDGGEPVAQPVITDHLFGNRDGRDLKPLENLNDLDTLFEWTDKDWRDFMRKWLSDAPHVSVLGVPSAKFQQRLENDEKERVKEQQKRLGEEGLKKLAEKLNAAKEENDKPIPDELLEQFPIPDTDSINFISTTSARAGTAKQMGRLDNEIQKIVDKDDVDSPLFLHFEDIKSNFARIKLQMCTGSLPEELKPLLSLYMMNFFTSPVMREGKRLEFEDVVLAFEQETINYDIGSARGNSELLSLSVETEPGSYDNVISWLRTMLFDAIHDPVRLHASLAKLIADIADEKRDGHSMAYAAGYMVDFDRKSSIRARTTLSKALYLKRLRKLLKTDEKAVLDQFAKLCQTLHRPENFRIFVAADMRKLPSPVSAWNQLTHDRTTAPLTPLDKRAYALSPTGAHPGSAAYIIPMATIDSSFAILTGQGPSSHDHPDLPALLVAQSYMDAVEGPLWVAVRGSGLAYGMSWSKALDVGKLSYGISRSPDAFKAYLASREQVENYASGKFELDKFALEGAVSEIVLNMANEQPTMASAAALSYSNQVLRGIAKDWNHQILPKIREVTPQQVRDVMGKYMVPALRPDTANLMVTCSTLMGEGLEKRFREAGFKVQVRKLEEFQDDYGLESPDGEDEPDSEESDEEMEDGEDDDESDEEADSRKGA